MSKEELTAAGLRLEILTGEDSGSSEHGAYKILVCRDELVCQKPRMVHRQVIFTIVGDHDGGPDAKARQGQEETMITKLLGVEAPSIGICVTEGKPRLRFTIRCSGCHEPTVVDFGTHFNPGMTLDLLGLHCPCGTELVSSVSLMDSGRIPDAGSEER